MKKLTTLIIIVLIGISILMMVLSRNRKVQDIPQVRNTIDTTRIHTLRVALEESKVTIEALQDSLYALDSIINNNQTKVIYIKKKANEKANSCLLYTSPSPRDYAASRMPSSA